nr:MAG TPA: hypothetical protein [Caudoviricetes sp.]
MGKILIPGSSGGGVGSDDVTASKAQVLQGYTALTADSDDEPVQGTMVNRGNVVDTVSFENAHWESKFVARMEEGYYSQAGQWKPCVAIPYAVLAGGIGVDAGKMLDTLTISGVRGTIPVRGYHGPDSSEMWLYPQEGGYVVRIEEGYYHKGGQWKPYVIAPTSLVKGAVNYHPEATLNNTTTCGEQGQIKMVDTKLNNYTNNQARNIGIDYSRGKLYMEFGHGNAYYYRDDNTPHVEVDASRLGTAGADSVLQWQTASSQHGLKFEGTIPRWICGTGDVISAVDNNGFAWDDSTGANRGRGIVTKIPNGHFIQGANYVFLPAPYVLSENIREGVNMFGVPGGLPDYRIGRPVFENATFNTLYVGGVANKDFPEAGIYRDRTATASNYSRYAGGTTINVSAGSNFHLWSSGQYVGFVLDRAILFTFFRQLKITYKLDVRMNTGSYNRKAGVDVYVHLYDAANRSSLIGGMHKMHSSSENAGSTYNGDTYEMIVDTSSINRDAFVALCASAYSDYNMSSAIGSVTFTKIELIN